MSDSAAARRAPRWSLVVAALVVAQAAAFGLYLLVEGGRAPEADEELSFERLEVRLTPLVLERPGASRVLGERDGVVLLHLWATWCRPCREELPALLALDGELGVPLVAVSTDEGWPVVDHYFDGDVPPAVWRLQPGGAPPMRMLPTTLVVKDGRVIARLEGARRWSRAGVERLLCALEVGACDARPASSG